MENSNYLNNSCHEAMYDLIGEITFYPLGAVSFPPLQTSRKHLTPAEVSVLSNTGVMSFILGARSDAKLSESDGSNGQAAQNQVSIKFSIENPTAADMDRIEEATASPHHLLCRSMNEGQMWVPCLGEGYKTSLVENDGKVQVEITIASPKGSLRVLS